MHPYPILWTYALQIRHCHTVLTPITVLLPLTLPQAARRIAYHDFTVILGFATIVSTLSESTPHDDSPSNTYNTPASVHSRS